MEIDAAEIEAALPAKEAKFFVALSRAGIPSDPDAPAAKLDEYLDFLKDQLMLESHAELRELFDMPLAEEIARAYKDLLAETRDADEATRLLVVTGVRYFVNPQDAKAELKGRDGLQDDLRVLGFLLTRAGSKVAPPETGPGDPA